MKTGVIKKISDFIYDKEKTRLSKDVENLFLHKQAGHMGKWQYSTPHHENDIVNGEHLYSKWIENAEKYYVSRNYAALLEKHAHDIYQHSKECTFLVDLGPGDEKAVSRNTFPVLKNHSRIQHYWALDICSSYSNGAAHAVKNKFPQVKSTAVSYNFYEPNSSIANKDNKIVLYASGTIGNYTGHAQSKSCLSDMIKNLTSLKSILFIGDILVVGLDTNQNAETLYDSYNHPLHELFEMNLMQRIKRDIIPNEIGFIPTAWKYKMRWYPETYQFCHIAEATESQRFSTNSSYFTINKGDQFIIDNSFKFPVGVFQQAAIHAGYEPLASYLDDDKRMALHVLRVVG